MASTIPSEKIENEGTQEDEKPATKDCFTLEVLRVVKDAQLQHGLRHGDYQRYRQYCARRIRRTRKALHFPQGTKHKVQPKKITKELVKDSRFLLLVLIDAERAWAYAMQLKSEANTEPRKRFHMISRLRKAVQHADTLDRLCNDSGLFDARTRLEVQAYCSWMRGLFDFELEKWKSAMEMFSQAKTIYEKLSEAVSDEAKEIYQQRCGEISPNIRYCAYNIGDESAIEDLMQMRMQIGREDPLTSRLDELIEKTRERQAATLSEVVWCGRTIPVKNEQVRVLLLSIEQNSKQLTETPTSEQKLSMYESVLKELIEAQQALRDEYKDDPVFKSVSRGQQLPPDTPVPNSVHLHTYLSYLRQTYTVERNLLMIEALKAAKQDGKKNKPQDFARLFDIIVQNLSEILHLPGVEEQATLTNDINVQIVGYKSFKCFYVAQTYLSVKKWKETLALYERALEYARQSIDGYKKTQLEPSKKSKDTAALQELVKMIEGLKYSVHAQSILDSQDIVDPAVTVSANISKPLDERLQEYIEDPSLTSKKPHLTRFPPDFEPIPAKPLFFDLALSLVQFPSLADKVEQKQQTSGLSGYIKGWLPWGKK